MTIDSKQENIGEGFKKKLATILVPEEKFSLKLIFDNVRNYLICGGFLVAAIKVFAQYEATKDGPYAFYFLVIGFVGILLTILNILQTIELNSLLERQLLHPIKQKTEKMNPLIRALLIFTIEIVSVITSWIFVILLFSILIFFLTKMSWSIEMTS